MAYPRNPNDPYDPYRSDLTNDEFRRASSLDSELQPDPELAEGPASGGRITLFAVAIAIVLGAVFYGLNNTSVAPNGSTTAQSTPANPTTAQNATPPVAPGVRDVTPRRNTEPGTTTGAATSTPPQPPSNPPVDAQPQTK